MLRSEILSKKTGNFILFVGLLSPPNSPVLYVKENVCLNLHYLLEEHIHQKFIDLSPFSGGTMHQPNCNWSLFTQCTERLI